MHQSAILPLQSRNGQSSYAVLPTFLGSRLTGLIAGVALTLAIVFGGATPAFAQLAATQLITTNQPAAQSPTSPVAYTTPCDTQSFPGCTGTTIDVTFGVGSNIVLDAVIAGGSRFEPAADLLPPIGLAQTVIFRRNALFTPERELLFLQQATVAPDAITLAAQLAAGIEDAMLSNIINRGIDNVFNNITEPASPEVQVTSNNIERIDYIIPAGLSVPLSEQGNVGFLILERGGNDAFQIAAITALDANGDPSDYGPLLSVPNTAWGNSNDVAISTAVFRRDNLADPFQPSHLAPRRNNGIFPTQPVRGIVFTIESLVTAPQNASPIFGYSLFAPDVTGAGTQLVAFNTFPQTTDNQVGGLDLIAGGFGLVRRTTTLVPTGSLALVKRITNLFGPSPLPDFSQVVGNGAALALLQNNGLGQGLDVINDPVVQTGNGIEYTIYLANASTGTAANTVVCDQIPLGTTFDPNGYGSGLGIQAIAASSPAGPVVNYTNAADGDPGTFFAPGAALPPFCGTNQGNGAVVVNVADVTANQVGLIRFRTTVD
ncbi:DUF11 domain-containing protein [Nodosilinea sp. E11]|uniref:DUF11 domain-containing protein n=1 Tax=Nodosilinea sp. E11 TaxID=3037479 RepID=UPI002934BF6C|nr:DUF11 domain-containing protein [Nodosilinea sp. E11]WOD40586.1 DUF11 domain-containing protein [Nodosilinea sp. E11]